MNLIDYIFPHRCIFCNTPIYRGNQYCEDCIDLIPFADDVCPVCAKKPCICGKQEFAFTAVASVFYYELGAENAIKHLKFYEYTSYAKPIAKYLFDKLRNCIFYSLIDVILPVPMSKKDIHKRGYNQSALLAQELGKLTGIPCCQTALVKIRQTKKQHLLTGKERRDNLKAAFFVSDPTKIAGKTVLLCDDVYTTGSTFHECAQTLLSNYAKTVYCISVATTKSRQDADLEQYYPDLSEE